MMGRIILRAARDRDLYCEWSTGVEAPIFIGAREDMLTRGQRDEQQYGNTTEDRLRRADEHGSSACDFPFGHWADEGFIWEQRGVLRRERLADALDWILANDHGADIPSSMLDAFGDEREVRPARWEAPGVVDS